MDTLGEELRAQLLSTVIRLRGLPYDIDEPQIRQFFEGFETAEITIFERKGRPTGEAYVKLTNSEVVNEAIDRLQRENIGQRYIELFKMQERDLYFYMEGRSEKPMYVCKLRGLPFNATVKDIYEFLNTVEVDQAPGNVIFTTNKDGKPSGECFVVLPSELALEQALKLDKQKIGQRYIEIFVADKWDMLFAKRYRSTNNSGRIAKQGNQVFKPPTFDGSTLKLRGLPWDATVADIQEFFQGFMLAPDGVKLYLRDDQQRGKMNTGIAYVQFVNPTEAERAKKARHMKRLGKRYIECMQILGRGIPGDVAQSTLALEQALQALALNGQPINGTLQGLQQPSMMEQQLYGSKMASPVIASGPGSSMSQGSLYWTSPALPPPQQLPGLPLYSMGGKAVGQAPSHMPPQLMGMPLQLQQMQQMQYLQQVAQLQFQNRPQVEGSSSLPPPPAFNPLGPTGQPGLSGLPIQGQTPGLLYSSPDVPPAM